MQKLADFARFIERNFERGIAAGCICIIATSLIINVFFRYVLSLPLTWPVEIVSFLFPWFVYLGASYGVREGAHIRLTHHVTFLPRVMQRVVRIVADLCWLLYSIVMTIQGIRLVRSMFEFRYMSQVFAISRAYVYMIVPLAFFLMSVRVLGHIVRLIRGTLEPYTVRQRKQLID